MSIVYHREALQALMESTSGIRSAAAGIVDRETGDFNRCRESYNRLCSEIQEQMQKARSRLEAAESEIRSTEADYNAAMSAAGDAGEESENRAAMDRARQAQERLAQARMDAREAEANLQRQQAKMQKLTAVWEQYGAEAESLCHALEEEHASCVSLVQNCNQDLQAYMTLMDQARSSLYGAGSSSGSGGSSGAAGSGSYGSSGGSAGGSGAVGSGSLPGGSCRSSASPAARGWCPRHSMQSVTVSESGKKEFSMSFGGVSQTFLCTKSGIARAYDTAVASGDPDLIARTSAMFEIETLREDLELGRGFEGVAQLGGYHRDVRTQDPKGYESHHIPARSVQDVNAEWLPAISITHEDHETTSSFRGKQNHAYQSCFSPGDPAPRYKDSISQRISQGSSGYIEALRNEVYDLRVTTGHKYDGGISGYLDAVIDMLITRGIPKNK